MQKKTQWIVIKEQPLKFSTINDTELILIVLFSLKKWSVKIKQLEKSSKSD